MEYVSQEQTLADADALAAMWASTPRQDQQVIAGAAEFVICDHTIEESFRDDKSGGFDLHSSHLADPKRLDTLLLALAMAVLWIYELGQVVLADDKRSEIDPAYKRQLSVFQLGWRLLRRLISCAVPPPCTLRLRPFQPEPVWLGNC